MKPYFERDGVRIFHADCRELLPQLYADVVVTDPPYGIADAPIKFCESRGVGLRKGGKRGRVNTWHPASEWDRELDPSWIVEALRIGPVALFGHWRKRLAFERACGMEPRAEIVWAKNTHVGPARLVAPRDERIWIFSSESVSPQRFETSVWDEPIISTFDYRHHKNEKPVAIMRRLVALLPGAIVLDPFMGSGTTLLAARLEGRLATGIEADERYCEIAAKRLAQGVLDFSQASEVAN